MNWRDDTCGLELVGEGFTFPTSLTFDDAGRAYVAEAGLPFGGAPPGGTVWRLDAGGGRTQVVGGGPPPRHPPEAASVRRSTV
jgi:hypothetical protein